MGLYGVENLNFFFDEIVWTAFHFGVYFTDIKPRDTYANGDNTADKL